jgi:hypothetical protein
MPDYKALMKAQTALRATDAPPHGASEYVRGETCWAQVRVYIGQRVPTFDNCKSPVNVADVRTRAHYCKRHGKQRGLIPTET